MEQYSEHVAFQLPNEHTRVRYLIDAIQCNDPKLQASLAAIRKEDDTPSSMMNDFKNAVTFLLPSCPVAKKRKTTGSGDNFNAEISFTNVQDGTKKRTGKTGVELRYHKKEEYGQLDDNQKDGLREWIKKSGTMKGKQRRAVKNEGNKYNKDNGSKREIKRTIASLFREEMNVYGRKTKESSDQTDELKRVLIDFAHQGGKVSSTTASSVPERSQLVATKLQGILSRNRRPKE